MFSPLLQMVSGDTDHESLGKLKFLVDFLGEVGLPLTLISILGLMLVFFFVKGENTGKLYGEITLDEVLRQNQFGTCTVLLRSEFLEIPYFNNLMGFFGADWPLWCFMLSKGPGYNMEDLTAIYHVHAGGASSGRDRINILRDKLENRMLMIDNFPEKKRIIKKFGLKIIFNYFWKSALMQHQYATALARNRILVWRYIKS